jgi:transcriptional regulator with XRE-family HTH domain
VAEQTGETKPVDSDRWAANRDQRIESGWAVNGGQWTGIGWLGVCIEIHPNGEKSGTWNFEWGGKVTAWIRRQSEVTTIKNLRNYLIKKAGSMKARRFVRQDTELCERLDETLLGFRAARRAIAEEALEGGWLRAVRQATGIPVHVLQKRLGVTKYEVFRLEKAERTSRIGLANLRRAAEALGCELVYALIPREGSLEDLAATERASREAASAMVLEQEKKKVKAIEKWIDLKGEVRRNFRKELRRLGLRVR